MQQESQHVEVNAQLFEYCLMGSIMSCVRGCPSLRLVWWCVLS